MKVRLAKLSSRRRRRGFLVCCGITKGFDSKVEIFPYLGVLALGTLQVSLQTSSGSHDLASTTTEYGALDHTEKTRAVTKKAGVVAWCSLHRHHLAVGDRSILADARERAASQRVPLDASRVSVPRAARESACWCARAWSICARRNQDRFDAIRLCESIRGRGDKETLKKAIRVDHTI
jgi:hypothetical protein